MHTLNMWKLGILLSTWGVVMVAQAQFPQAKPCPKPVSPTNGRARLLYGGIRAEYSCNPGYMTMGTNYALCAEGRWTWDAPLCVAAGCSVLKPMAHGFMAVSYSGAVVRFWCEDGFFMKGGGDLLICDGHAWNDTQPDCISKAGSVAWGDYGKSNKFSFNYKPHRKHKSHHPWGKTHEEWLMEADYTCITQTSAVGPPRVPHASPSTKWVVEEGKARLYTVYRCKWGYVAIGDADKLYCQNKDWIGTKPKCIFKGIPAKSTSYHQADDWSSYGVNAHDERLRKADYSCFKSVEGVTAPDVRDATMIPRHKVIDGMPHLYVEYQCHPGYSLDGPSEYMYCKDEQWHGDRPKCIWKGNHLNDEGAAQTVCEQNNGGCSHTCTMESNKAVCSCSFGMELNSDEQTCGDIDECKDDQHGCEHTCFNTHGSYECLCKDGYTLSNDGFKCHIDINDVSIIHAKGRHSPDDKIPPMVVFHN